MTAHNVTTVKDIVKPLQYVTEGNCVTTPSLYGVTPTASPVFTAAGLNLDIDLQPDVRKLTVDVLGSEDIVDAVKSEELFAWTTKFEMTDTVLAAFGINAAQTAAHSFCFSEYLDGTEYFNLLKGSIATNTTMSLERGKWICDQTYIAKDIITRINTANAGLTTPTFVGIPTASPMVHSGAGADPFTWNSVAYPENKFTCSVTRQLATMAINGNLQIEYSKRVGRTINFNVDVFCKGTTLEIDARAGTLRSANYSVSTSPDKDLAFTNAYIDSWKIARSATSKDAFKESIGCIAESVAI